MFQIYNIFSTASLSGQLHSKPKLLMGTEDETRVVHLYPKFSCSAQEACGSKRSYTEIDAETFGSGLCCFWCQLAESISAVWGLRDASFILVGWQSQKVTLPTLPLLHSARVTVTNTVIFLLPHSGRVTVTNTVILCTFLLHSDRVTVTSTVMLCTFLQFLMQTEALSPRIYLNRLVNT